jgi:hypothetical protein
MAVPWLTVGKLVLGNLDSIIRVVKPAFTRKKVEALPTQTDLLNQQIVELQTAASNNAEQIGQLAAQLKEVVAALEQAGSEAAAHRAATRKLSYAAIAVAAVAVVVCLVSLTGCSSTPAAKQPAAAASLAGLHLEVPCANPKFNNDTECHWDQSLLQTADPAWKLKREIVRNFRGKAGAVYEVTFHVRGVVEPKNFTGGEVQHEHFQSGGTPVKNDYNFYSLHVSDPEGSYTFNRNEEKVGHYTFPIDYQVTIPIRAGAVVTMGAYDSNDVAIANHQHFVIDGVAPAPQPFDGQFFQLDVVSIKARK